MRCLGGVNDDEGGLTSFDKRFLITLMTVVLVKNTIKSYFFEERMICLFQLYWEGGRLTGRDDFV